MKSFKWLLVALICVAMMSGPVWGYDETRHVTLAPEGTGDVLIYPFYFTDADAGFETKITVINTDDTRSVVAKIIFNSYAFTQELLDFLLYLSPNDVWTGTIRMNNSGEPIIYSEDDSAYSDTNVWSSPAKPLNRTIATKDKICPNDSNQMGYVTVFESWSGVVHGMLVPRPGERTVPPVTKSYLARVYDQVDLIGDGIETIPDTSINSLAGYLEFGSPVLGLNSAVQATVLKDYNNTQKLDTDALTYFGLDSANRVAEVEAVLAKESLLMPYLNNPDATNAIHIATFPTKQSLTGMNSGRCKYIRSVTNSDFWPVRATPLTTSTPTYYSVIYERETYDMKENTPGEEDDPFSGPGEEVIPDGFPFEVNFASVSHSSYDAGWIRYNFDYSNGGGPVKIGDPERVDYTGAPVIGTVFLLRDEGISLMKSAYTVPGTTPGSRGIIYTDDTGTEIELPDYQVCD